MKQTVRTYGRMELAQAYFPQLEPRWAWKKFKSIMQEFDELSRFLTIPRRTFTPAQVQAIFADLGVP